MKIFKVESKYTLRASQNSSTVEKKLYQVDLHKYLITYIK